MTRFYSKKMAMIIITIVVSLSFATGFITAWLLTRQQYMIPTTASTEIQHILNCQDSQTGAINDVWGETTWVVPGEMALATIALHIMGYEQEAHQACEYLALVQDQMDGGWFNQYSNYSIVDHAKYTRHTAQVLMAFHLCNYTNATPVSRGIAFLSWCIDNQTGGDHLIRGGKMEGGGTIYSKWLSDNVFAAKVFEYYGFLALKDAIMNAVDDQFKVPGNQYWYQYKDENGTLQEGDFGWINFAPPVFGLHCNWPSGLIQEIQEKLQTPEGAILEHANSTKKMPGIGLQVHMAAREIGGGKTMLTRFYKWLSSSGLVQEGMDENGDTGGIIDWKDDELGTRAQWWERFIDTSAFTIFNELDFRF